MLARLTFLLLAMVVWSASASAQTLPAAPTTPPADPAAEADRPPGYVGPSLGHPRPIDTSPDFAGPTPRGARVSAVSI